MNLRFTKMSGAGNDFILIEKQKARGRSPSSLARRLCPRREIGADGLLALEKESSGPRMRYYNADGSEAFCGNGARCAAAWAHARGWTAGRRQFQIHTRAGRLQARITGPGTAALSMPEPRSLRLNIRLKGLGRTFTVHSIETGVPHAVVITRDVEKCPVALIGKALRNHRAFKPKGTNVDFLTLGPRLQLRTYERGVEAETLACGTGAVAAALVATALGKSRSPVSVETRGGDILKVSFKKGPSGAPFTNIQLEGPARIVYAGEVPL